MILQILLLNVLMLCACQGQQKSPYNEFEAQNPNLNEPSGDEEMVSWPLFGKNFLNFGKLGGYSYISNLHAGGLFNPLRMNGFHSSILGASNPNANDDVMPAQIDNQQYEIYGISNQSPNVQAQQMYIQVDDNPAYMEINENVNAPIPLSEDELNLGDVYNHKVIKQYNQHYGHNYGHGGGGHGGATIHSSDFIFSGNNHDDDDDDHYGHGHGGGYGYNRRRYHPRYYRSARSTEANSAYKLRGNRGGLPPTAAAPENTILTSNRNNLSLLMMMMREGEMGLSALASDGVRRKRCTQPLADDVVGLPNLKSPLASSTKEKRYLNRLVSSPQSLKDRFKLFQNNIRKPNEYFAQMKQQWAEKADLWKAHESKRLEHIVPFKKPDAPKLKKVIVNNIQDLLPAETIHDPLNWHEDQPKSEFVHSANYEVNGYNNWPEGQSEYVKKSSHSEAPQNIYLRDFQHSALPFGNNGAERKNDWKNFNKDVRAYINTNNLANTLTTDSPRIEWQDEPRHDSLLAVNANESQNDDNEMDYLIAELRKSPHKLPIDDVKTLLRNHLKKVNNEEIVPTNEPQKCCQDMEHVLRKVEECCLNCKTDIINYMEKTGCSCNFNDNQVRSHNRRSEPKGWGEEIENYFYDNSEQEDIVQYTRTIVPDDIEMTEILTTENPIQTIRTTDFETTSTSAEATTEFVTPEVLEISTVYPLSEITDTSTLPYSSSTPASDIYKLINQLKENFKGGNIIIEIPVNSTITDFKVEENNVNRETQSPPSENYSPDINQSQTLSDFVKYLKENPHIVEIPTTTMSPTVGAREQEIYDNIKSYIQNLHQNAKLQSAKSAPEEEGGESAEYINYGSSVERQDHDASLEIWNDDHRQMKKSRKRFLLKDIQEYEVEEEDEEDVEDEAISASVEDEVEFIDSVEENEESGYDGSGESEEHPHHRSPVRSPRKLRDIKKSKRHAKKLRTRQSTHEHLSEDFPNLSFGRF